MTPGLECGLMHSRRHAVPAACALLAAFVIASAHAEPRWAIARPVPEGKQSPLAATPLQKRVAEEKELVEKYPVYIEHIEVQGFRPRDPFAAPPRTKEQQFADALNEGSPEMIAGRSYDGYYYDGTLFWGSDPLSFAWRNVKHWVSGH
ncbi:MAG TPA: hypothetical protein VG840_10915 [Casimicrobiaceae bacterium]|nr:hypothetical protein [Casimicrobiaceae bacterium]